MAEIYASVAGHTVTALRLTVGSKGPWVAECDFEGDPDVSGGVTLRVGDVELVGTVDPSASGTEELQRRCRIIAGGGGWGASVAAKHYHNDAGVKARTVADDAARLVGEQIGDFAPAQERLGNDYVRTAGAASSVIEDVIGAISWWVDYAGVTHVGERASIAADDTGYEVLGYDPRERKLALAVTSLDAVGIGSVVSERLDVPQTVHELLVTLAEGDLLVEAWSGGEAAGDGLLPGLLRAIVARATDGRLYGLYLYRVLRMDGDRVELQSVRSAAGLPDILPVSAWPGLAGCHAQLSPSSEVLVQFVEGRRSMPVVTHFAGKDGVGFAPIALTIGGDTGAPSARQGDAVEILLPPAVFTGTIGGSPATGVITFTLNKAVGVITAGSTIVKVAS